VELGRRLFLGTREFACRENRQRNSLQIVEIPITPQVEEHRLHQRSYQHRGRAMRAELPKEVDPSGYGPRLVATVAVLSRQYRHSYGWCKAQCLTCLGIGG